jgi:[ribosomal protein S5]-alanine N-acetyltransferase
MIKKNDIYIRLLSKNDITERYLSWFKDDLVTKFLDARNLSKEEVLNYIKSSQETGSYYIYAICLRHNDLHIGNIKIGPIKRNDGISDLVTVVGDNSYWGKGIARLAIIQAVNIGFNQGGIRKFSASINSLNSASVKAYTGAGLKVEAIIKNYFYNKIENKIIISDKVFVGCENKNFNMDIIKDWSPFL